MLALDGFRGGAAEATFGCHGVYATRASQAIAPARIEYNPWHPGPTSTHDTNSHHPVIHLEPSPDLGQRARRSSRVAGLRRPPERDGQHAQAPDGKCARLGDDLRSEILRGRGDGRAVRRERLV